MLHLKYVVKQIPLLVKDCEGKKKSVIFISLFAWSQELIASKQNKVIQIYQK